MHTKPTIEKNATEIKKTTTLTNTNTNKYYIYIYKQACKNTQNTFKLQHHIQKNAFFKNHTKNIEKK